MYQIGYAIGKIIGFLTKYKWYVLLTLVYWFVMAKLEEWLKFDLSLSIFFIIAYVWWLFMEIRMRKIHSEKFFTASTKYLKWYIQNLRFFLKGDNSK